MTSAMVRPIRPEQAGAGGYDPLYATFDSTLTRQMRREAYGEDIGQHSWVTADELRSDLERLALGPTSRLVDLGCGPCGPLVFAVRSTGCLGLGVDASPVALASGKSRAKEGGVEGRVALLEADLNLPLPLEDRSFDAAISLDVVLHLSRRDAFFNEVARLLDPGGKFLFTDAGVITGAISSEEIEYRSANGPTQFAPMGLNEELLAAAGFRLLHREDRTDSVVRNATGRRDAMVARQSALERLHGAEVLSRQMHYLEAVIAVSERRALSRMVFLAELA